MTRAHHYRIITPVTRSVMLRGNDRAGISASWKGQRIVFRRRGGREGIAPMEWRVGLEETILNMRGATWRSEEASFLASPPFDRGYYVKRRVPFWKHRVFATPEDLGQGSGSFAWQGLGRMTDSRYRARSGLLLSSYENFASRVNDNSLRFTQLYRLRACACACARTVSIFHCKSSQDPSIIDISRIWKLLSFKSYYYNAVSI